MVLGINNQVDEVLQHIVGNLQEGNLLQNDVEEATDDEEEEENEDEEAANLSHEVASQIQYDEARAEQSSVHSPQTNSSRSRDMPIVHDKRSFNHRFTMNFRDIEESMKTFDGTESLAVEVWLEEFEETALVMQWDSFQKFVFAKKLLKGLASLFIRSERGITSWEKFKEVLLNEYKPEVNSAKLHKQLSERKIKKDEPYQEYFLKMKELASRGNVEEKALIQYVIDGINDLSLNKAVLYGANSLKEFKEKLKNYETMNEKNTMKPAEKPSFKKNTHANVNNNKTDLNCYNCGGKGHKSSNCKDKDKGAKCFRCNKFGHLAKQCDSRDAENQPSSMRVVTVENDDITLKNVKISNQCYIALFDTGSKVNVIKQKIYHELQPQKLEKSKVMLSGFGNQKNRMRPLGSLMMKIEIDENEFELEFHVISDDYMDVDIIIGYPICTQAEIIINANGIHIQKLETIKIMNIDVKAEGDSTLDLEEAASLEAKQTVQDRVENYRPNKIKTTKVTMKIILSDETPISCRPRRLP